MTERKVLIVTGTLSPTLGALGFLQKAIPAFRESRGPWFAIQSTLEGLELPLLARLELRSRRFRTASYRPAVESFMAGRQAAEAIPDLAEVSLATSLRRAGVPFEAASISQLTTSRERRERLLDECEVVFLSTTYVKNLSELRALAALFKRPDNRVVVGGAFVGLIHDRWQPLDVVDVVAVGYGELLVPALASWIRSSFQELSPPPGGRLRRTGQNVLVYSGVPESRDLDYLEAPDWSIARDYHGQVFEMVHYESVRGCPYRCAFCNYPFLFDDNKFRIRSAERIADDWQKLADGGAKYINCLDSLFTMPKRRLLKLCELLIERGTPVKWICYARADDLAELETCKLMREAGCVLVSMGIESGSQVVLDNMNKRCSVEANALGIRNAKQAGLTVNATIIVGFPGDTPASVQATLEFLQENPPDFVSVSPFGVGSERMPVLSEENRARFDLHTAYDGWLWHAYWKHSTMSAEQAVELCNWLKRQIAKRRASLDTAVFYQDREWNRATRDALLSYQHDYATRHRLLTGLSAATRRVAAHLAKRDIRKLFSVDTKPNSSIVPAARLARRPDAGAS